MGPRRVVVLAAVLILAACGGGEKTVTVYLSQRLGPDGPPGQIAPVLMPVERTLRSSNARPYQIVQLIRQGPAPGEWGKGFVETIDAETRIRSVSVLGSTATVELDGEEPDLYGSAAIVYSLTSLPDIDTVQLRAQRQRLLRPSAKRTTNQGADRETFRWLARRAVRFASADRRRDMPTRIVKLPDVREARP